MAFVMVGLACPKSTIPYLFCLLFVSSSATTGVHVYFTPCMVHAQYVQEGVLIKLTADQGENCPLVLACGIKDFKGLDHTRNPTITTLLKWPTSNTFAKCSHSVHIKPGLVNISAKNTPLNCWKSYNFSAKN